MALTIYITTIWLDIRGTLCTKKLWLNKINVQWRTEVHITWLLVKTLKIYKSASGANPIHSLWLVITPATKVPCPSPSSKVFSLVQLVRSLMRPFLKCGWSSERPVSKIATLTPAPVKPNPHNTSACNAPDIWNTGYIISVKYNIEEQL